LYDFQALSACLVELVKAGQTQEADLLYTAKLQAQPKQTNVNHNLGVVAFSVGKL
jgi:hypothetical protein